MNMPFLTTSPRLRLADLGDPQECQRLERYVAQHPGGTAFHRPAWIGAVARGTGNQALTLVAERNGDVIGYLPLTEVHSPIFGRMLAGSGFGVGGGILADTDKALQLLLAGVEELALRRACACIELRGGPVPEDRESWIIRNTAHCGFIAPMQDNDEAQLLSIPKRQRAEVRKGIDRNFTVETGSSERDRQAHFAIYSESMRNLGTPMFPRELFDAVLDAFGEAADIMTIRHEGQPVSSVLSLYHRGAVMPYWGGGIRHARVLRSNEYMYYALMCHGRIRGCTHFDFGRSKTGSGPYNFKRNWGFTPEPLSYGIWTAPGSNSRDADPSSGKHARQIAIWQRLPLSIANRLGPLIARGLG